MTEPVFDKTKVLSNTLSRFAVPLLPGPQHRLQRVIARHSHRDARAVIQFKPQAPTTCYRRTVLAGAGRTCSPRRYRHGSSRKDTLLRGRGDGGAGGRNSRAVLGEFGVRRRRSTASHYTQVQAPFPRPGETLRFHPGSLREHEHGLGRKRV